MIPAKRFLLPGLLLLVYGHVMGYIVGKQQTRIKEQGEIQFFLLGKVKSDLYGQ